MAENPERIWILESRTMDYSLFEILLYNLRHVQHHVGQLNLLLRQHINHAPDWIEKASKWTFGGEKSFLCTKYQVPSTK